MEWIFLLVACGFFIACACLCGSIKNEQERQNKSIEHRLDGLEFDLINIELDLKHACSMLMTSEIDRLRERMKDAVSREDYKSADMCKEQIDSLKLKKDGLSISTIHLSVRLMEKASPRHISERIPSILEDINKQHEKKKD